MLAHDLFQRRLGQRAVVGATQVAEQCADDVHVHLGRRLLERQRLSRPDQAGQSEQHADLFLGGATEHRRLGLESEQGRPQPRWVSRIWPTFIRLGTPSGLSTMSTGRPSGRNGMSSSGTMRATMPLLPCRPAILSPTEILRFSPRYTFTSWITPGGSSSGWRILSIWSSAFSSTRARSRAAASMVARIRSLAVRSWTRRV